MPFDAATYPAAIETDPVLRILIEGRARIERPENWTRGALSRDGAWCARGALFGAPEGYSLGRGWPTPDHEVADHYLGWAIDHRCVATFNNDPGTTHADVLGMYDRAVAARRAEIRPTRPTFAIGSRVSVGSIGGRVDLGTVRPFGKSWKKDDPARNEWRIVRFDDGSELSVHVSNLTPVEKPVAAAFAKGQRVMVSYGVVKIMQAVGAYARKGRVVSRKDWRRGWYGVEIGWDVATSTPVVVTAHVSALDAL